MSTPEELQERARSTWGAGNFAAVAEKILDVGDTVVERAGVEPGMEVLDVACGSGNATLPAAKRGARVVGLDIVPSLLEAGRERAAAEGLEIEWIEGDALELPFGDDSFDRVLSTFGHMFAPDHARAAAELVRVTRPGGAIAFACWTPEGAIGDMFRTVVTLVPPPPGGQPPPLWGVEQYVRDLLGPHVRELEFERRLARWEDESPEAWVDFMQANFGPIIRAGEALGERAGELREALLALVERWNQADDGSLRFEGEYLVTVARL